jgi:phospholipid-translocating ATPase
MVLIEQFQYFFNLFFLFLCISQFIPAFQVGLLFSYVAPLVFVLLLTLLKEIFDEVKRYLRDRQTNIEPFNCFSLEKNDFEPKQCQDIQPGDVLKLQAGQRVPADCMVLKAEDKTGQCYIKTDQLDGETDWKLRKSLMFTQKLLTKQSVKDLDLELTCEPPHKDIYAFKGIVVQNEIKEGVGLENMLWSSTSLCSVGATVLVVFVGKETRINMNISKKRNKFGSFDNELNQASKIFFVIMFIVSVWMECSGGSKFKWEPFTIGVVKYILLVSSIIPISLRVNLDFSKILFCYRMGTDPQMPGAIARNSSIPEELGRIKFILSDKTGTITQNQMELKNLYSGLDGYNTKELGVIKKQLKKHYMERFIDQLIEKRLREGENLLKKSKSEEYLEELIKLLNLKDHEEKWENTTSKEKEGIVHEILKCISDESRQEDFLKFRRKFKRQTRQKSLFKIIRGLALCHNVSPVIDEDTKERSLQASSPDEIALVEFCESLGIILKSRNDKTLELIYRIDKELSIMQKYEILNIFPFSSETKRMGIIIRCKDFPEEISEVKTENVTKSVKEKDQVFDEMTSDISKIHFNPNESSDFRVNMIQFDDIKLNEKSSKNKKKSKKRKNGQVVLFVKGADFVMKTLTKHVDSPLLTDNCEELSYQGLRTLGFGYKNLSNREYKEFRKKYKQARNSLNRETACRELETELMQGLDFLGVSGVEDKLQEDCAKTIQGLRQAGIRIWMLTGDKIETVQCIAISTGIKTDAQSFYVIKGAKSASDLRNKLDDFSIFGDKAKQILIIDGAAISHVFPHNAEFFFKLACDSANVICCRCSPTQKAQIAQSLRIFKQAKILCVGDGGNDVPMILAADVGVGIQGKEGKQAAMASDFSLLKFRDLGPLLLYHGRNSYKRGGVMALFVIHRGLIISFMQILFSLLFGYIKIPVFNGILMLGYSTVYTMLPVFSLVFSEDLTYAQALKFPKLYQKLQKGRELSLRKFLQWTLKSLFQAFVIIVLCYIILPYNFSIVTTISYSALILTELLNTISNVNSFSWVVVISLILSILVFAVSMVYFPWLLDTAIFKAEYLYWALLCSLLGVIPLELVSLLRRFLIPTEVNKLRKKAKLRGKGILSKLFSCFCCCFNKD